MKARISSVMLLIIAFVTLAMVAFAPMPMHRAQEGGPILSEIQLVYVGIIASGALWLLRLLASRGWQPKKEIVAIALYVVSFVMAIVFMPVTFPPFPPFADAPSFVGALLSWVALLLALASPVAGMAYLIYNVLLKRVLEGLANRAAKAFASPKAHGVITNVRAKFKVVAVTDHDYGDGKTIKLAPCYDASVPEDRRFAQATPTAELSMYVNNPLAIEALKLGKYFYLDFTPIDEA